METEKMLDEWLKDPENKHLGARKSAIKFAEYHAKQLGLFSVSESSLNKKWAKSREETAQVREKIAINWVIGIYADEEMTDDFKKEVWKEFRNSR